jgi:hypothetical protein
MSVPTHEAQSSVNSVRETIDTPYA